MAGYNYQFKGKGPHFPFKSSRAFPDSPTNAPDVREEDVTLTGQAEVHLLDLSNEDDVKLYQKLRSEETKGLVAMANIERQWVPQDKTWRILAEVLRYYVKLKDEDI